MLVAAPAPAAVVDLVLGEEPGLDPLVTPDQTLHPRHFDDVDADADPVAGRVQGPQRHLAGR